MRVRAIKYYYANRTEHHPGDEFEFDDRMERDCDILCRVGVLERIESTTKKPEAAPVETTQTYQTKVAESEPPAAESEPEKPMRTSPRQYYRRRDMRPDK